MSIPASYDDAIAALRIINERAPGEDRQRDGILHRLISELGQLRAALPTKATTFCPFSDEEGVSYQKTAFTLGQLSGIIPKIIAAEPLSLRDTDLLGRIEKHLANAERTRTKNGIPLNDEYRLWRLLRSRVQDGKSQHPDTKPLVHSAWLHLENVMDIFRTPRFFQELVTRQAAAAPAFARQELLRTPLLDGDETPPRHRRD